MLVYALYSNSYSLVFKDKVPRGDEVSSHAIYQTGKTRTLLFTFNKKANFYK